MNPLTLPFKQISAADLPLVGGKGANLGEMTQAGFPIPGGFCVSTTAFQRFMEACPNPQSLYATLNALPPDDVAGVRTAGEATRQQLNALPMPDDVAQAILAAWQENGANYAYAVRSSATAEDLPSASFAGQQDTYLNIMGQQALLESVKACWISLFTDRAILYRAKNGFPHESVELSVVVQQMVLPQVSGILFTADPVSNNRHIISIDAGFGLGEALVSGLVSADLYRVDKRTWHIVHTSIADKKLAILPKPEGGTYTETLNDQQRTQQVLSEAQIIELAQLSARIEAHYGKPQDIEWCFEDDTLYIVQSRPITSLFPLPAPIPTDDTFRIYISFSHTQVMTDPMPPMGISIWRILFPFGKIGLPESNNPYLLSAAGRIYVDITPLLHHPVFSKIIINALQMADKMIVETVLQVMQSDEFENSAKNHPPKARSSYLAHWMLPLFPKIIARLWFARPEGSAEHLSANMNAYIAQEKARLQAVSPGADRLKVAATWLGNVFEEEAMSMPHYVAGGMISRVIIQKLLGNRANPADIDALWRGMSGNVTTEMDLAVGDLADLARQSPQLVDLLINQPAQIALEQAKDIPNSEAFLQAWATFITHYGMRGPSEIDITRPRWADEPASIMQVVVGNLKHAQAGSHRAHHKRLAHEAEAAGERLVASARYGLFGPLRAAIVQRMIQVTRNLMPIREHPKFLLIQAFGLVREAILEAAEMLVDTGRIDAIIDVWFLELPEVILALENPATDLRPLIIKRQNDLADYQHLIPPRVITSDGEIPVIKQSMENIPPGALPGTPVSSGVIEGIARVVLDPATEILKPGEILVAPFTDPGWTPLFINAAGLVMEVGGLMTHGSVVAREYGIPAVVGVLDATTLIQNGQRIRVRGDLGYVEILDSANNS